MSWSWWDDLSDSELRARLEQRGVDQAFTDDLIDNRAHSGDHRKMIHALLGER